MDNNLEKELLNAAGKEKTVLASDNPYFDIGFDENKKRLGWVKSAPFFSIKESLSAIAGLLKDKENFIFIGMGGSINGIKPLFTLFEKKGFYTLDNLDPEALLTVINQIDNLEKTLVISISKSGTTKETQLLSLAIKELFVDLYGGDSWSDKFLWLSDPDSFSKLDSLGWEKTKKISIQFDKNNDIGGRFSSPHTLIFLLPLFLLLNKDFDELENVYISFISLQNQIRENAYSSFRKYKNKQNAYFIPLLDKRAGESFSSWIVQLFQESLGSKQEGLPVKTLTGKDNKKGFSTLDMDIEIDNSVVALMSQMYFFQIFVAYYAAFKNINFVNQGFVEKYKQQMQELEKGTKALQEITTGKILNIAKLTEELIRPDHDFIEIILYFYPTGEIASQIQNEFQKYFKRRCVLTFVGSDWNHQSYRAAFGSKDTFYVLLLLPHYQNIIPGISSKTLSNNVRTLKIIAHATYLTIKKMATIAAVSI